MPRHRFNSFVCSLAILFLGCTFSLGEPKLTGKKWLDMDYGPYKATTIEASQPKGNFAYKGIAIRVGENKDATICFDTDTLRYSAGWTGGWLNLNGVVYDGKHWAYPSVQGDIQFSNPVGPGWASPDATSKEPFKDPRFRGNDKLPYGPLPREWGQWRGLYVHGDNVVLSYTVGGVGVLELPGALKVGDQTIFTRTLNIGPSNSAMTLQIADDSDVDVWLSKGLIAGVQGAAQPTVQKVENATRLIIPPHTHRQQIKVFIAKQSDERTKADIGKTVATAKGPTDLIPLTKGGPAKYSKVLTTKGQLGKPRGDSPYAFDTITWPDDNPWHSWLRFGGFDFFEDGKSAAICTWSGDVWIVSGIDDDLDELKWRRIAAGMFQPLGVKIVKGQIYVTCRDQITRLVDLNGDGETDFYEAFNHDHQVTEHFHEFAMDLQTDKDGNFYYAKSARHARDSLVQQHGTLLKVSPDGKKTTIVANGYRAANGVGVAPGGKFFTSDQEGHWMPANRINLVREGSFSGNMYSYHMGEKPTDYDRPIVWLPKPIDRSPAEQVYVSSDKWGLPKGSLISLSYGTGFIQNVMYEMVEGLHPRVYVQGAFHRLVGQFPTGIMRGRFHPNDGQLYACGLFGWSSNQTKPGGFFRIRYTGKPVDVPIAFKAATDGIVLTFTNPLDKELAADTESYQVQQWNYKWSKNYGSPEFKLSDGKKGRDDVSIKAAHVSKDGKSVWLEIPNLKPSMQIRIKLDLDSAKGDAIAEDIYGSVHVIPKRSGGDLLKGK